MCIDTKRELLCNFFILVCSGRPWQSKAFEVAERSEAGALESPLSGCPWQRLGITKKSLSYSFKQQPKQLDSTTIARKTTHCALKEKSLPYQDALTPPPYSFSASSTPTSFHKAKSLPSEVLTSSSTCECTVTARSAG